MSAKSRMVISLFSVLLGTTASVVHAAKPPSVGAALRLRPVQHGINYDIPDTQTAKQCKVEPYSQQGAKGWIVRHPAGHVLRRFLDTNNDNVVDVWSYYREGLEVYRDIDSNYNGKADQYRWLNLEGGRWGLDTNEDREIDRWRIISAEEATAEAVRALAKGDYRRLSTVMVSREDLAALGVGRESAELLEKIAAARNQFQQIVAKNEKSLSRMRWLRFDGSVPSIVPADVHGTRQDLHVHQNVLAMVEIGQDTEVVFIGEMVRVGDAWKLVEVPRPQMADEIQLTEGGWFLRSPLLDANALAGIGITPQMQEPITQLQALDEEAMEKGGELGAAYHLRRAELLEQIAGAAPEQQQEEWIRQYAEELVAAAQTDKSGRSLRQLNDLFGQLQKQRVGTDLIAFVEYRRMSAAYTQQLQAPKANLEAIQAEWLKQLEGFVKRYPRAGDTPDAMLQLAITHEFAGNESQAKAWYKRLAQQFPQSEQGQKAAGALKRLDLVGKDLQLRGKGLDLRPIGTTDFRGKVLLVSFWASWSEPSRATVAVLRDLYARYHDKGFEIMGVSLDSDATDAANYVRHANLNWPQIYEPGGLDSRSANALGIVTLPSMILLDEKGEVVDRAVELADLEAQLQRKLR